MKDQLSIAFVTPEVDEFHIEGGLGNFGGSLPRALGDLGHKVNVFMPAYPGMKLLEKELEIDVDGHPLDVFAARLSGGVPVHIIDKVGNNGALGKGTYGGHGLNHIFGSRAVYSAKLDDYDVGLSTLFSRGAIMAASRLGLGSETVFHANEWASALVPFFLRERYSDLFAQSPVVYTIHNNEYQGEATLYRSNMQSALRELGFTGLRPEAIRKIINGSSTPVVTLGAGKAWADIINTVSPTYAKKIGVAHGILNGLDTVVWNPARALGIGTVSPANIDGVMVAKRSKKREMQQRFNLEEDPESFVVAYMHRFDAQKGIDVLADAAGAFLMNPKVQLIARGGTRMPDITIPNAAGKRVSIQASFAGPEEEALIYAGADLLFMPSRYEPCGYSQRKAMSVGTVPLVTPVDGLLDTVTPFDARRSTGNGLQMLAIPDKQFDHSWRERSVSSYVVGAAIGAIPLNDAAMMYFTQGHAWKRMIRNGLAAEWRWDDGKGHGPAHQYVDLYREAFAKRSA